MCTLPKELILHVLCESDPRDVVRWRTVSRGFHAITYETALWKALYENAPFPRPHGPLSAQSGAYLERALLKAARLVESWTTRPMRSLSSLTINTDNDISNLKLISGRWLVTWESDGRFVLHDVDPVAEKHTRQVLWEKETPKLSSWDTASLVSPEGHHMVYVVLRLSHSPGELLEFQLNHDTGEVSHSAAFDLPQVGKKHKHKLKLCAGNSQLLLVLLGEEQLVLDTRTHLFHKVPSLNEVPSTRSYHQWIVFDTGLIFLNCSGHTTTVHVFTLLSDGAVGEDGQCTMLSLTHQGIIDARVDNVKAMWPTTDLATGSKSIRLVDYSKDDEPLGLTCVEMTLQKCSSGVVLPIIMSNIHKIELPRERVRLSRYRRHRKYVDVSDDGQIRGFFRAEQKPVSRPWNVNADPLIQLVMKFNIDTTQDPWVITRGRIVPAEWSVEEDPRSDGVIGFDGMRGRLFCVRPYDKNSVIIAEIE